MLKSLLLTIVGIAISAGSFAQTDSVKKPVFTYVEQMPKPNYPINTYLADSLRYPQQAKAESISGRVIVRFIVSETGSIDSVRLHKSVHPLLDSEAVRVVRTMPKWNPGIQNGQPVSVHYTMPVNFSLQDEQQVETDTPKLATQVIDGDIYLVKDKDANRVILQHPIKGEITIYTYLQKMPEPKYDIYKFISKNIQYPIAAKEEKIEGTVAVIVIVTETGKIKFARVAKSIHTLLDEEAKRIINTLPDWIPGIQSGQPVNSYYMIPVKFEL